MSVERKLQIETEAAKTVVGSLRDILADDDELKADTIEGETNLHEALVAALHRVAEIEAHADGINAAIKRFKQRGDRLEAQAERIRAAIALALEMAELPKIELPTATIALRKTPPKVIITSEADIPSSFFKEPPPVIDKKAILDALKANVSVPGAELSNGGMSITVRVQ